MAIVYFFFWKLVSTFAPMLFSNSLALSAWDPVGAKARYLLRFSAVPGGATILLSLSVAFASRFTPYQ